MTSERRGFFGSDVVRWLAALHGVGIFFILLILVASALGVSDHYRWTADVAAIPDARPYEGLLSNLGIIAWSAAAAIALFTGLLSRGQDRGPDMAILLVTGGLATTVLLVDDLFLLHDTFLPEYVGIPEEIATLAVGMFPLAFLWWNRRSFGRTRWQLLAVGVAYLAVMVVVDFSEHRVGIPGHHVWEEGSKLLGILHWCGYLILTAKGQVREMPSGTER